MNLLKKYWADLKSAPINTVARWQDARFLWLLMAAASLSLLLIAHNIFQHYVYMPACEQCVYIRFAFFCMLFGGLIASINPKVIYFKLVGYALAFWGIIQGIGYSATLHKIHESVHGDDPFGVQGCAAEPTFPFNLPLDKWSADWFLPTGDCGYDNPIVPEGVELSWLQEVLVNFYSEGWYLIPSMKLINMAQACWFAFVVCLGLLGAMFISWIVRDYILKSNKEK